MKDIAEKYPKVWTLVVDKLPLVVRLELFQNKAIDDNLRFSLLFGYLVLEFFPKYGIYVNGNIKIGFTLWVDGVGLIMTGKLNLENFKTPQQAIEKAFEILEKQLND